MSTRSQLHILPTCLLTDCIVIVETIKHITRGDVRFVCFNIEQVLTVLAVEDIGS